jgi:hypothetical protein
MKYKELTPEQQALVLDREIQDLQENPGDYHESIEFLIRFWLENTEDHIVFDANNDWTYA